MKDGREQVMLPAQRANADKATPLSLTMNALYKEAHMDKRASLWPW